VRQRLLFVWGATLLLFANVALSEGAYQHTRNGRALIWNDHPKAGDEATWSGGRDREGYARGFGTLIWYTKETDSAKPALYARYWGNMVEGKFNGPVNVHSKKKTHYAIFADGARTTHWSTGTASSRAYAKWRSAIARQRINSEPSSVPRSRDSGVAEPEAPAEGPSRTGELSSPADKSIRALRSEHWPMIDIDDSLRLLVWPPRSLRTKER
jgi:hypothetical protein